MADEQHALQGKTGCRKLFWHSCKPLQNSDATNDRTSCGGRDHHVGHNGETIILRNILARYTIHALQVLHNLMIISVGAEAVVQRFGLGEPFQDAEELGVSGNVPYSSKAARNALREYFARREGLH